MTLNQIVNIAAYKFIDFNDTREQRSKFQELCHTLNLKGTILLSPEGINLFLAGTQEAIDIFLSWLKSDARFTDIEVKKSFSEKPPFKYMLVKLKREIVTMKMPVIQPVNGRAPAISANTLKRWLDQGHDESGKPVVLLDTRNDFEVDIGSFEHALDYRIKTFSEFPAVISEYKEDLKTKTIVAFCTGGIRCEKAVLHMQNIGLNNAYQLEGGILKYFEEVGAAHYRGDCFVFDERIALSPSLKPNHNVTRS